MNHSDQTGVRTPYPRMNFERIYNYLSKMRATYPASNSLSKSQIVEVFGLSSTSGTTHSALGALSHYGFARKTYIQQTLHYELSDLALKLLEAEGKKEWRSLALQSVTLPETFSFLYSYEKHDQLPGNIESLLIDKYNAVNKRNVKEIIRLYFDSMNFINRNLATSPQDIDSSEKIYKFALSDGIAITAKEEVIIEALLEYYLKVSRV